MSPFLIIFVTSGALASVWRKKLTPAGGALGAAIAFLLYAGGGWTGIGLMAAFFVLATAATAWRCGEKQRLTGEREGPRTAGQVWANAGVAALCGLPAVVNPSWQAPCLLLAATAFSSATADTLSSELGTVLGRRFFNILTGRRDQKGLDGVISLEGLLAGAAGSVLIGLVYALGTGGYGWIAAIVLCGTFGNLCDSVLGAALERRGRIKNNAVNFLNTLLAVLLQALLWWLAGG